MICLDSFTTGLLLDQHYDNSYKHDAASYKCGLCLRRFISEEKREKHIGDFHSVPDTQTEVSFFKITTTNSPIHEFKVLHKNQRAF